MNPPFNVQWIDGWLDVTSDLDDPNAPWTFAKSNGVGALQFSIAEYKRGLSPNASPQVALSIIQNIASPETLTDVHITQGTNETPHIATGSFPQDDYTTQVWCITDGHNFCTATYTCLNDMHSNELAECEKMIQTFRFQPNQWPNQSLE